MENALAIPGQVTPVGLVLPEIEYEEWERLGGLLTAMEQGIQWYRGDWLNYGEHKYGEKYSQALDAGMGDYQTLANYAWVAKAVPLSVRTEKLSWNHHLVVASLPSEQQKPMLDYAIENKLSVRDFKAVVSNKPPQDRPESEYEAIRKRAKDAEEVETLLQRGLDLLLAGTDPTAPLPLEVSNHLVEAWADIEEWMEQARSWLNLRRVTVAQGAMAEEPETEPVVA